MRVVLHHAGKESVIPNASSAAVRTDGGTHVLYLEPGDRVECHADRVMGPLPKPEPAVEPPARPAVKPPTREAVRKPVPKKQTPRKRR